jgi:hypothetical protein
MPNSLLLSVLTNGAVVAVVTWFLNSREARARLRAEYLRVQLEWLYGPLSCQLSVNAMLLKHADHLSARGLTEYGPTSRHDWQREHVAKRLSAEGSELIKVNNEYASQSIAGNAAIVTLIKTKYHLLDPVDQPRCNAFILNDARLNTERDENKKLRISLAVYDTKDPILYLDHTFVEAIQATFARKQRELSDLVAPGWLARWSAWSTGGK